jgi:hypothetical protein
MGGMADVHQESRQRGGVAHREHCNADGLERSSGRRVSGQRGGQNRQQPQGRGVGAPGGEPTVSGEREEGGDGHSDRPQHAERFDRAAAGLTEQTEQLPRPEPRNERHEHRKRPAAVPHDGQGERDGDGGEPDPLRQIAIHQADTRPNRRLRPW